MRNAAVLAAAGAPATGDAWYLGNSHLMTATPNARLIDVALDNGAVVSHISFQQITTNGVLYSVSGSRGKGVEFELAVRPLAGLQLQLTGDWQHSTYKDNPAIAGNQVQRQPTFQYRFSPSYRIPLGEYASGVATLRLYGTYSHIGGRRADHQNTQYLPSYNTLDLGFLAELSDKLEFSITGTSVNNTLGLTEGNSRFVGSSVGPINARPVCGRAWEASLTYRF